MEFKDVVTKRRSIRKYLDKEVSQDLINEVLNDAILAPSWKNSQTARYYVVKSKEMLDKIKKDCLPEFNANNVEKAPVLIITAFVKSRSGFERDGQPTNELGNMWGSYDLGLHNQNLLLSAYNHGLGTLIMGIRNSAKLREYLQIDDSQEVVSVIGLGYPDINPDAPKRKTIEDIVRFY